MQLSGELLGKEVCVRRLLLVLAITAFVAAVVLPGSGLTQEIPPTKAGPEKGCEGIWVGANQQDDGIPQQAIPKAGTEPSAAPEVGKAHFCKTEQPTNPYNLGSSGGQQ